MRRGVALAIAAAIGSTAFACARPAPAPRVCEAPPRTAKQPTVVGMCTLDAPPQADPDAGSDASDARDAHDAADDS